MITFDPAKRDWTFKNRGLRFEDVEEVFADAVYDFPDDRRSYGEVRVVSIGRLKGRMVVIVWTRRGGGRHIISMRKANEREQARFQSELATAAERLR